MTAHELRQLIYKAKLFGWQITGRTVQRAIELFGWEQYLLRSEAGSLEDSQSPE